MTPQAQTKARDPAAPAPASPPTPQRRIIRPDAKPGRRPPGITVRGGPKDGWRDLYHHLLTVSWPWFAVIGAGVYMGLNAVFALLYWLDPQGLANAHPGSFADAFNFSVETLGTIGFGAISPRDGYSNGLVTIEAFISIAVTAVFTGIIFARVSRPTARVLFSRIAVVAQFEGKPTLMFRAANQRGNQVLEAEVTVSLALRVVTEEGVTIRRFEEIRPRRARTPLFALTWTVMHLIDETSPLHGATAQSLAEVEAEIVIVLSGLDETFNARIHARHSYIAEEIVWGRHFEDVVIDEGDGRFIVDYTRFHDARPDEPAQE